MYSVTKRIEIAGSHQLQLPYESPCCNRHGHNWIIEVEVKAEKLDFCGMVIDFQVIKSKIILLDHQNINDILPNNPTAENIAKWIVDQIQPILDEYDGDREVAIMRVTVQESEGNTATWTLS